MWSKELNKIEIQNSFLKLITLFLYTTFEEAEKYKVFSTGVQTAKQTFKPSLINLIYLLYFAY